MKINIVKDSKAAGQAGYELFKEQLENGSTVFGLATGSTPISTYDAITASDLDFSNCISINLDEYAGLPDTHEQSYRYFMNQHFFSKKPFKESYVPNGMNHADAEIARYEKIIAGNPVDFQILGLGQNGHIGFNEPGTAFDSRTHKVALTESTIAANARFFDNENDVPKFAYSMGIGTIMDAKSILLEAFGENKADAVQKMVEGPVTEDLPASILQRHPNVTLILDEAAASKLSK
ncbi:glucosamine-6-phosphate deaminase [Paucilactobacillus nenjiangensis]|uniref:glucosamine-6-phosphate deaminase n=1 Tax=Paucilactobacillus nenjiangensis TaxID=1296540 RepID=UPI0010F89C5A|nr:glucosamine-6-phosphate deaminase [Paucilactobacillus nenjiangensis]